MAGREQGLLGDLARLDTELRRGAAEQERLSLELDELGAALEERSSELARLAAGQASRREYLAFRLREQYKDGPELALRRIVRGPTPEPARAGARYVEYLAERDARFLQEYRAEALRIGAERDRLAARRLEREALRDGLEQARLDLRQARSERAQLLARIRDDRATREMAIAELERASAELTRVVESIEPAERMPALDVRKFRGLLDWPAAGRVSSGFGNVVHPRFGTTVPHPGLDLEAPVGTEIRTVFDGRVVFASWMRGYGLTALVDHGSGVLSVYAHAAVLLVEPGDTVVARQSIGLIGDTGALRGPCLYFEIRESGRPVDPADWLRPR